MEKLLVECQKMHHKLVALCIYEQESTFYATMNLSNFNWIGK